MKISSCTFQKNQIQKVIRKLQVQISWTYEKIEIRELRNHWKIQGKKERGPKNNISRRTDKMHRDIKDISTEWKHQESMMATANPRPRNKWMNEYNMGGLFSVFLVSQNMTKGYECHLCHLSEIINSCQHQHIQNNKKRKSLQNGFVDRGTSSLMRLMAHLQPIKLHTVCHLTATCE